MSSALRLFISGLLFIVYFDLVYAMTRRVPQEYMTIQAALDSVLDGDTVLVAVGIYQEALIGPRNSNFVLRGDVVADTGDYPRPMIDPSSLPRPDTVACLRLDVLSENITIEDLAFRNGREMYDTIPRHFGGILNASENLTLRRCLFDSTYGGISGGTNLFMEDCRFEFNRTICARTDSGAIIAQNCYFSCRGGSGWNVSAKTGSRFINCQFSDNDNGNLFNIYGDSVLVEDCIFGPYGPCIFSAIEVTSHVGCILRRNVFTDFQLGYTLLHIEMNCSDSEVSPIVISDNHFLNFHGGLGQNGAVISTYCQGAEDLGFYGIIENNIFENGSSSPLYAWGNALYLQKGKMLIRHNRFTRLDPQSVPDVYGARENGQIDTLFLQDNLFDSSGYAAAVHLARIAAPWNWWGDATGPQAGSNPNGHGGQVGSGVDFTPWYTDTSFFNLSTDEPRVPHPSSFSLSVYPNPFNSTAKIKLQVREPMIVKVELFDLLGRKVKELYNAPVAYEKEISFQADNLASGVYFVKATDTIWNRPLATQKMLLMK